MKFSKMFLLLFQLSDFVAKNKIFLGFLEVLLIS